MSLKINQFLSITAALSVLLYATPSMAEGEYHFLDADNWQFRLRGIVVAPDTSSDVNIGGEVNARNAVVPEFDITHYFTDNISAELILATSKHDLDYNGTTDLGDAMALPPTLTLQYHFMPESNFNPYVGAGVNYTLMYNAKAGSSFSDLDIQPGVGYAAQAGFDYWLNDHWGLNFDAKKIWVNLDATVNNGSIQADIDLDPWVVGAGIAYRF